LNNVVILRAAKDLVQKAVVIPSEEKDLLAPRSTKQCHPEQREGSRHGDQILRIAQDDNIIEWPQGAHCTPQSSVHCRWCALRTLPLAPSHKR
jgi:hypothetical protein